MSDEYVDPYAITRKYPTIKRSTREQLIEKERWEFEHLRKQAQIALSRIMKLEAAA